MFAARILYPVRTLGPGERIGIWLSGCHRGCPGCSNPELWEQKPGHAISVAELSALLHRIAHEHQVDGVTITGGEPFEQSSELACLLDAISDVTTDVLLYTGGTLEELLSSGDAHISAILSRIAVLIDGDYRQELNDVTPLAGSTNQRIHYFRREVQPAYEAFLQSARGAVQNFTLGSSIVSVGIHHAGYDADLPAHTTRKGLIPHD